MIYTYIERENFYHIVKRYHEQKHITWQSAWKCITRADKKVNNRVLFPTFKAFTIWRKRYEKTSRLYPENAENGIQIEEMHDFGDISKGALAGEIQRTRGVSVSQWNRSGKDWLDKEEARHDKWLAHALAAHTTKGKITKDGHDTKGTARRTRPGA